MPGLIRGMARTAVVAGTATAVSNRVSRRQANRWAQEDQSANYAEQQYAEPQYVQQAPQYVQQAPPPPPAADPVEQLTKLGQLRDSGVLTQAEFEVQKAKILSG
jgi:Short C-terminal domain